MLPQVELWPAADLNDPRRPARHFSSLEEDVVQVRSGVEPERVDNVRSDATDRGLEVVEQLIALGQLAPTQGRFRQRRKDRTGAAYDTARPGEVECVGALPGATAHLHPALIVT